MQTPTRCSFIALIILISYPVSPWCLHSGGWDFFFPTSFTPRLCIPLAFFLVLVLAFNFFFPFFSKSYCGQFFFLCL